MPVYIRELVVKAHVSDETKHQKNNVAPLVIEADREQIIDEAVETVLEILAAREER